MVICPLCNGWGKRFETVVEYTIETSCTNCDGTGKVPLSNTWRPFEESREAVRAAKHAARVAGKGCNLHDDCAAAEKKAGLPVVHCSDSTCEECWGY